MSDDILKTQFLPKYLSVGEEKFYRFLLFYAVNKMVAIHNKSYKGITPDLEFLEYYTRFLSLYRREGDENFLNIAKIFRKTAHKIYRLMLKKNMTSLNYKFLNLV